MKIGVDYYPEQWDRALWKADSDLMAKIGVKLVRIGEFAWSKLEPRDGQFNFQWLDEAISTFSRHAIGIVLYKLSAIMDVRDLPRYRTGRCGR